MPPEDRPSLHPKMNGQFSGRHQFFGTCRFQCLGTPDESRTMLPPRPIPHASIQKRPRTISHVRDWELTTWVAGVFGLDAGSGAGLLQFPGVHRDGFGFGASRWGRNLPAAIPDRKPRLAPIAKPSPCSLPNGGQRIFASVPKTFPAARICDDDVVSMRFRKPSPRVGRPSRIGSPRRAAGDHQCGGGLGRRRGWIP